ncbi:MULTISPECIES: hypothetical protein [Burkholderia]|uniref:hypothetical protein n=1 Tax=Burkholderia TaxID=32008 RepID=UPI00075C191B|nr:MULTISPECIES: hypothetical protein [Burkholderia]AOJ69368.1 hypothetical protein WS78_11855 [Burkholderia savannae]KVG37487.1 hypothetical protein WS77_02085 [Burkholderia sp. MSMB0265]KVG88249.1 hypothetical protein WS81_25140 [Burkholderia sp. MSMB2040]KVG93800.1 hypothetical protein WS82_08635 [Burkholderia sp. MSMB2041]KVH01052.1 hypothetical protein WS83_20195 [Burkholderia sp. MSMB2042]
MTTTDTPRDAAPADLQGLRRAILTTRAIVRDQYGMLSHPAIPYLDEDVNYQTFFSAFGLESTFVNMETDVDGDAYDQYVESNDPNCSFWTPSAPAGDGWLLLEIFDTENGPVALYVREKKHESLRERWKREERETDAARDVLAERRRQVEAEGWTPKHDDAHSTGDMALAAACYAVADNENYPPTEPPDLWPWDLDWWKPTDERRNLVKAGALILAEIERLDRAAFQAGGSQ